MSAKITRLPTRLATLVDMAAEIVDVVLYRPIGGNVIVERWSVAKVV